MLLTQNREERLCLSVVIRLLTREVPGVCSKGLKVSSEHTFICLHKCDPSSRASPTGKEPMSCPHGTLGDPAGGRRKGQAVGVLTTQRGAPGHTLNHPGLVHLLGGGMAAVTYREVS